MNGRAYQYQCPHATVRAASPSVILFQARRIFWGMSGNRLIGSVNLPGLQSRQITCHIHYQVYFQSLIKNGRPVLK